MQLWMTTVAAARGAARTAQEIEAAGWDGMLVVDSQNLSGDPYVALALAATATTRLGLGTGVTNSVTRHAAATATAITSVNRISNGRAVLGIGRGDSALAHLGRAPARLAQFERYLRQLQTYLGGEAVSFDDIDIPHDVAPPMSELHLHDAPPVEPHRLDRRRRQGAGRGRGQRPQGDRHVGPARRPRDVHPGRRRRAPGLGHRACEEDAQGGGPRSRRASPSAPTSISAATPTSDAARSLVRGGLTTFARFSVMHGKAERARSRRATARCSRRCAATTT